MKSIKKTLIASKMAQSIPNNYTSPPITPLQQQPLQHSFHETENIFYHERPRDVFQPPSSLPLAGDGANYQSRVQTATVDHFISSQTANTGGPIAYQQGPDVSSQTPNAGGPMAFQHGSSASYQTPIAGGHVPFQHGANTSFQTPNSGGPIIHQRSPDTSFQAPNFGVPQYQSQVHATPVSSPNSGGPMPLQGIDSSFQTGGPASYQYRSQRPSTFYWSQFPDAGNFFQSPTSTGPGQAGGPAHLPQISPNTRTCTDGNSSTASGIYIRNL